MANHYNVRYTKHLCCRLNFNVRSTYFPLPDLLQKLTLASPAYQLQDPMDEQALPSIDLSQFIYVNRHSL